jgi:hypothetical protein
MIKMKKSSYEPRYYKTNLSKVDDKVFVKDYEIFYWVL